LVTTHIRKLFEVPFASIDIYITTPTHPLLRKKRAQAASYTYKPAYDGAQ